MEWRKLGSAFELSVIKEFYRRVSWKIIRVIEELRSVCQECDEWGED